MVVSRKFISAPREEKYNSKPENSVSMKENPRKRKFEKVEGGLVPKLQENMDQVLRVIENIFSANDVSRAEYSRTLLSVFNLNGEHIKFYESLKFSLKELVVRQLKDGESMRSEEELLNFYIKKWEMIPTYIHSVSTLLQLFSQHTMARMVQEDQVLQPQVLAFVTFRDLFFKKFEGQLTKTFLECIRKSRNGESFEVSKLINIRENLYIIGE